MYNHKTWMEIDRVALLHNLKKVQKFVGSDVFLMAIVKANAYGHGLGEIAKVLKNKKNIWFGADTLEEALMLKRAGIRKPIMIFGYIPNAQLKYAIQQEFHISIYSKEVLHTISEIIKNNKKLKPHLHLKIETGTNRLGIQLKDLLNIPKEISFEGVYTHFAEAENPKSSFYQRQLREFRKALFVLAQQGITPRYIHTAATAALLQYPETHEKLVRLGIGLYGLWPSPDVKHRVFDTVALRPVLTWKTRIAQIKTIKKGETVGYDRTWRAKKNSKIAILPAGYYDGYDRRLSNCGEVLIKGKRVPVIGRVCMNMCMIDVTAIPGMAMGDEVVLLGRQGNQEISADDIAKTIGTINYEVITKINPLIPRIVLR